MIRTLTASALALAVATPALAESWDMPVAYPATNYLTLIAQDFASCVSDKTGGALTITVHPNGSLFNGADIKRAVQTGQAQIGERLLSAHENENALFGYDSVPFIASSFDASNALAEAVKPSLTSLLESQNLVLIYSAQWAPQGLYTKIDVNSAADLRGIKFRAYNAATARIAAMAGMEPVQIEAAELAQALATGVVESFLSSGSTGVDSKVWESLTHWYDLKAWLPRNTVFANKDAFEGLPEDQQAAIVACGEAASVQGEATVREVAGQLVDELRANGMTVEEPSDQLRADFEGYGEVMLEEWLAKVDDATRTAVEGYIASQQ